MMYMPEHSQCRTADLAIWGGKHVPHLVKVFAAGDAGSRQLSGLLLRELVRGAPDTFAAHASAVLPCAFVACHDDDTEVAGVWKDVWEEGTGSPAAATRLHISEITGIIQTRCCHNLHCLAILLQRAHCA